MSQRTLAPTERLGLRRTRTGSLCAAVVSPLMMLCLAVRAVHADDTLVTLATGGLVPTHTTEIEMVSEDLHISVHKIVVRYQFHNHTNHDVESIVAFPLPLLDGGLLFNSPKHVPVKDPVNFLGFHAEVDDKPVAPSTEMRAIKDGRDITAAIESLGLPVSVLDRTFDRRFNRLTAAQREDLEQSDIAVPDQVRRSSDGTLENIHWPFWNTQIKFYWTQRFPAGRSVRITHSYQPFVGGSYVAAGDDGSISIRPFCGTPDDVAKIKHLQSAHPVEDGSGIAFLERRIQFILTTANDWSGPIHAFRLTVDTDSPDDIVVSCIKGLRRTSAMRYEWLANDLAPSEDLDILILQPNRRPSGSNRGNVVGEDTP